MTRVLHRRAGLSPRGASAPHVGVVAKAGSGAEAPRGLKPALLLFLALGLGPAALAKDSCIECHAALAADLQKPALVFSKDVHSQHGFSCVDCHGGDRNADDPSGAMDPARGYKGKPARKTVPQLCARCHSDVALMRRYNPRERVDQYAEYQTSVHGKRIAEGDEAAVISVTQHKDTGGSRHQPHGVDGLAPPGGDHPQGQDALIVELPEMKKLVARAREAGDNETQTRKITTWAGHLWVYVEMECPLLKLCEDFVGSVMGQLMDGGDPKERRIICSVS